MQFALFEPSTPTPEKLAVTLARLSNLVGSDRVGAPQVVNTHRPGALAVEVFEPHQPSRDREGVVTSNPRLLPDRTKQPRLVSAGAGRGAFSSLQAAEAGGGLSSEESGLGKPRGLRHMGPTGVLRVGVAGGSRALGDRDSTLTVETKLRANGMSDLPGTACLAPTDSTANGTRDTEHETRNTRCARRSATIEQVRAPVPTFGVYDFRARRARQNQTAATLKLPGLLTDTPRRFLAFRCFRPPAEAEIILCDGLPVYIRAGDLQGPVCTRAGPWYLCGEWWTPEVWSYEEWDVEVKRHLYRICCEKPTQIWYVTGAYD